MIGAEKFPVAVRLAVPTGVSVPPATGTRESWIWLVASVVAAKGALNGVSVSKSWSRTENSYVEFGARPEAMYTFLPSLPLRGIMTACVGLPPGPHLRSDSVTVPEVGSDHPIYSAAAWASGKFAPETLAEVPALTSGAVVICAGIRPGTADRAALKTTGAGSWGCPNCRKSCCCWISAVSCVKPYGSACCQAVGISASSVERPLG